MSITGILARTLSDYNNPRSLGSQLRARRIAPLLAMIEEVHAGQDAVRIADIGGAERYWSILPRDCIERNNLSITIVNLPGTAMPEDHGPFRFVCGDGCRLEQFADNAFDIAHANSVVEHVGDWQRMVQFARELSRIAPRWFVQTPNYWFPVEPHCMTPFFHWLPVCLRLRLVRLFQLGHWKRAANDDEARRIVESARLLRRAELQALFRGAEMLTERLFGLPKSLIAVKR